MSDLSTEAIQKTQWEFYGAIAMPLYITIFPPYYTCGFNERYKMHVDVINTYVDRRVHWFMRGDQLTAFAKYILPTLEKDPWGYFDTWQREEADFVKVNERFLQTKLETLNDDELTTLIKEYREGMLVPFVTNNIIEPVSYYFQHELKNLLMQEGMSAEQASELMDEYGQAARPSYVKLAAEAYRHARTEGEKFAVMKQYYYIFNDYRGVTPVTEQMLKDLAASTPYEFAKQKSTEGISLYAQMLLDVMQMIATIQDLRKGTFLQMVYAAKRFGEERGRRAGIAYADMEYATWDEVENRSFTLEELRRRREPNVFTWSMDGFTPIYGEEAKRILTDIDQFILHSGENVTEVKGVCASKGKVTGRAVVVLDPTEFDKVQPGDILITMMTRPEFLPVMYKAAAFVCDEGGLTSHAAIVAREMRKPCVVGTRVGTRVFKEGDTLEVDASAGIVKKV